MATESKSVDIDNSRLCGSTNLDFSSEPDENVLIEHLFKYARLSMSLEDRIAALAKDLGYSIKRTKLKALNKKYEVPSVRKPPPIEISTQAIIDEVERDSTQANGPNFVKSKLKDRDMAIPRRVVRNVMHTHFPAGFDARFPGRKHAVTPRTPLSSLGPFNEVSADGHEKLGQQALRMGTLGLPIYGYKDKWSDTLLKLTLVPNSRSPGTIGHLFLDFVQECGGISIQLTTDKGSEIGWQFALQSTARAFFAPNIDPLLDPYYVILKSIHNVIIEAFWRWLKEKLGLNLKEIIWKGRDEHIFNEMVPFHTDLFYWTFVPLIQAELDEFRTWWNQHRIRTQQNKNMPSGHVPLHALSYPEQYAGLDCLIKVPREAVDELRLIMEEDVGPYDAHMSWFPPEFGVLANSVYAELALPPITLQNVWKVFRAMSNAIEHLRL